MAVDIFALERCSSKAEDSQDHGDDAAADEGCLHDDVHQEWNAVREIEPVDSKPEKWCYGCWADGATILKT